MVSVCGFVCSDVANFAVFLVYVHFSISNGAAETKQTGNILPKYFDI